VDKKAFRVTEISHAGVENGQQIVIKRGHDKYTPPEAFYYVSMLGMVKA